MEQYCGKKAANASNTEQSSRAIKSSKQLKNPSRPARDRMKKRRNTLSPPEKQSLQVLKNPYPTIQRATIKNEHIQPTTITMQQSKTIHMITKLMKTFCIHVPSVYHQRIIKHLNCNFYDVDVFKLLGLHKPWKPPTLAASE